MEALDPTPSPTPPVPDVCTLNEQAIFHLTLSDLVSTLNINILVFLLLLALFEHMRQKKSVYFCRRTAEGVSKTRIPPELPPGLFAWVMPIVRMPKEKILFYAGLDAYMLIRYIRFCFRVAAMAGVLGIGVLIPIYYTKGTKFPKDEASHLISIGNLDNTSDLLWLAAACAYFTTFFVLYLLKHEFYTFLELRIAYLAMGDPDVNPQKSFSVRVERIPLEFRTNVALYAFFDELFPNKVHSAVVSFNIEDLEELVEERYQVVYELEKALAHRKIHKQEALLWVPKDDTWCTYFLCRGRKVEKISYYEKRLNDLNEEIGKLQDELKTASEAMNKEEANHQENIRRIFRSTRRVVTNFLVGDPEQRASLLEAEYVKREKEKAERGRVKSLDGIVSDIGEPIEQQPDHQVVEEEDDFFFLRAVRDLTMDALRIGAKTGKMALKGAHEVTKAVTLLTLGTEMSSTGFVTFKSLTAASMAGQALLTTQPFVFDVSPAPEPRDIIWQNIAVPTSQIHLRTWIIGILLAFLSIFWGFVNVGIFVLVSILQQLPVLERRDDYSNLANALLTLLIDYLPTLLLLLVLQILPWLFYLLSHKYERLKTHSEVQVSIMSRYFYYQMINIFFTVVGGGLLVNITDVLNDARDIVTILGCTMPNVGVYFIQIIITKSLSALMWEFCRVWPLIQIWFSQYTGRFCTTFCRPESHKTEREKVTGVYRPPVLMYGWTYPSILLVLTICLTYGIIMPLALVFGGFYFVLVEIMYKFHVCYVYVPQYESGGTLWYKVFYWTLIALGLSQLTLIGYLINIGGERVAIFLAALPLLNIPFYFYCQGGYYNASLKLSLLAARRVDRDLKKEWGKQPPDAITPASQLLPAPVGDTKPGLPRASSKHDATTGAYEAKSFRHSSSSSLMDVGGEEEEQEQDWRITTHGRVREDEDPLGDSSEPRTPGPTQSSKTKKSIIVDYFELSAYAQPSLTQAPQYPEPFAWEDHHHLGGGGGEGGFLSVSPTRGSTRSPTRAPTKGDNYVSVGEPADDPP